LLDVAFFTDGTDIARNEQKMMIKLFTMKLECVIFVIQKEGYEVTDMRTFLFFLFMLHKFKRRD
jgi:hypothetical protein